MLVAVEESATAAGGSDGSRRSRRGVLVASLVGIALGGAAPGVSVAQIVPAGEHAPSVVQTRNGLPQVDINRPSGAGVSVNTYGQFDVPSRGVVLNNSPVIVQTQQAGLINGNPNLGAGQAARVIVNQVNSRAASQINGQVEVAGQRAEVVIANGSGISVNGGGFINTSRAILTTGTPNYAADGSVASFDVRGGSIDVHGAGLDAGATDQIDLLSRVMHANAAIHAKNLNVIAGANRVGHDALDATAIAGEGLTPYISIDVSQIGGMYANSIVLVGTEDGVGVSSKGVLAAQAGDFTVTAEGRLILTGQTEASGDIRLSGRDGVGNSGTVYAQRDVTVASAGALTNSGVVAAEKNLTVKAASIASDGTLGAGINGDGSVAQAGELRLDATGALTATGRNVAGGNAALQGASVNLAGGNTSANGDLRLAATAGDLAASNATIVAGRALDVRAAGMLLNDRGMLSSGGPLTINARTLSNRNGQIVSGDSLDVMVSRDLSNQDGKLSGAATTVSAGSLDNSDGGIEGDTLALTTDGDLVNRSGRLTQYGEGSETVRAGGTLDNTGGTIASNAQRLDLSAQTVTNDRGTIQHAGGGTLAVNATGAVSNSGGTVQTNGSLAVDAARLDNSSGVMTAQKTARISASDGIVNRSGSLYGNDALTLATQGEIDNAGGSVQTVGNLSVAAGGALSNTGGTISANGAQGIVDVSAVSVDNTRGTLTNAGVGTTTITASNVSNTGGTLGGNGDVTLNARTLANDAGASLVAGGAGTLNVTQRVDNSDGTIFGATALTLDQASAVVINDSGAILGGLDVSTTAPTRR